MGAADRLVANTRQALEQITAQLPSGEQRDGQIEMAEAVARSIVEGNHLVVEAGTGTGKTFAYLVPALLYGGKVIVSTGTKTLQDQLFQRDLLPRLRKLG